MTADPARIDCDDSGIAGSAVRIQLLHVPDCPLVDRVRATLRTSLAKTTLRVTIDEIEGPYPSPTLLIDGHDVTGRIASPEPSCRLDLPTEEQIVAALFSAGGIARDSAGAT
jgi:hypothetical protein